MVLVNKLLKLSKFKNFANHNVLIEYFNAKQANHVIAFQNVLDTLKFTIAIEKDKVRLYSRANENKKYTAIFRAKF